MSDLVIKRLSEALADSAGQREAAALIIYAPFGIVRGELTRADLRAASNGDDGIIRLQRVTVEHYSNHLPTGNYANLYLSLREISGFIIIQEQ